MFAFLLAAQLAATITNSYDSTVLQNGYSSFPSGDPMGVVISGGQHAEGILIQSTARPEPRCDSGWNPVFVSGNMWCARELRAPTAQYP